MEYREKENILRVFRHEIPVGLPHLLGKGTHFLAPQNGFHERPPGGKGGEDWFKVKWVYQEGDLAPVPDPAADPVCSDITCWREEILFPDMEAWNWEEAARVDRVEKIDRSDKMVYVSSLCGFFERLHMVLGFENALCALITDPDEVEAFLDRMVEFKCLQLSKIKEYYQPDVLNFHDDYGTQRGLFFSPDLWRTLFLPRLKKVVDHCHSLGMIFELHSCGKIEEIVKDIADAGVDCLQCMDINDIKTLKNTTEGKMVFGVSPDFQRYASAHASGTMSYDEIREDAYREFMTLSEGGNYYPFINPPITEIDCEIWKAWEQADQELRKENAQV